MPCAVALLKTTDIHCAFLLVAGLCRILILRLSLQKRAKRWRRCWTHSACEGHLWPADFVAWRVERRTKCNQGHSQGRGGGPTTPNATQTRQSKQNRRVRCSREQKPTHTRHQLHPTRQIRAFRHTSVAPGATGALAAEERPLDRSKNQRLIDSKALASRGTYCVRRSQGLVSSDRRFSYWYSTLYRITLSTPIS